MAFVPSYEHDIFVSYAHVDDQPAPGADEGWVTTLVRGLRTLLAQKLGRSDSYSLWMDHQLSRYVQITPEVMKTLKKTAILLVILSLEADPECGYAYIVLGSIMDEKGKYWDAVRAYQKVKKGDPEYESAGQNLASTYFDKLFEYEAAYGKFKELLELNPEDMGNKTNFAEANLATGRFEEAYSLAWGVLAESHDSPLLDPDRQLAMRFIMVSSLILQGNADEAYKALSELIKYYRSLDRNYKSEWSYKGSKNLIEQRSMDENHKKALLKLIEILEKPKEDVTIEEFERFFK